MKRGEIDEQGESGDDGDGEDGEARGRGIDRAQKIDENGETGGSARRHAGTAEEGETHPASGHACAKCPASPHR
jgi:hypothetical protein